MDLTELLLIKIIVAILFANGGGAAIGEPDNDGALSLLNKMFLRKRKEIATDPEITRRRRFSYIDNREMSYIHKPQEFLRQYGPPDEYDVYEIFRKLYLEAFEFEEQPTHSITDKKLKDMGKEFELSKCRKPRMKMIDLYDELGIAPDIIISPPAANVSRCGSNSGCCPKGQSCYHTGDNFKNKTITVLHIQGNDMTVKRYNVPEHELCECTTLTPSSSSAIPTVGHQNTSPFICSKRCTSYFRQDAYCQCNVCDPRVHKNCERLKKGKRNLPDDEARCVEEGECEVPFCNPDRYYSYANKTCVLTEPL